MAPQLVEFETLGQGKHTGGVEAPNMHPRLILRQSSVVWDFWV